MTAAIREHAGKNGKDSDGHGRFSLFLSLQLGAERRRQRGVNCLRLGDATMAQREARQARCGFCSLQKRV